VPVVFVFRQTLLFQAIMVGSTRKRATKTVSGKNYLVFWYPETGEVHGKVSIVPGKKVPAAFRFEGAVCKLPWREKGTTKYYKVKIVKEGGELPLYVGAVISFHLTSLEN